MGAGVGGGSRERLVEATRELLWEHGYGATSPAQVRARSGVGQGSMYHHFPTKVDLAVEALERNRLELEGAMDAQLNAASSPGQAVLTYLTTPRDGVKGCRFGRMTLDSAVLDDERLRSPVAASLTWYRSRVEQLLRDGQATGELRPDVAAEDVAAAIVALVQGAHVLSRADKAQETFDRVVRGAVTLVQALHLDPRPVEAEISPGSRG